MQIMYYKADSSLERNATKKREGMVELNFF